MVLSLQMERKSGFPFTMSITERDPETGLPREVTKLMWRFSSMTLEEPMRKHHHLNPYLTWAQVKNMTRQAEQTLKSKRNIITAPGLIDQTLEAFINLRQVSRLIRTYCWIGITGAYHPHDSGLSSPLWGQSNGTFGKFQQLKSTSLMFMGLWVCFILLIIPSYTIVLAILNRVFAFRTCLL